MTMFGYVWASVLCLFLAGICAHYAYGRYQGWQHARRMRRIEENTMRVVGDLRNATVQAMQDWQARAQRALPPGWYHATDGVLWKLTDDMNPNASDVHTNEVMFGGYIIDSRFTLYAESESDAIDALMGPETVDE